MGNNHLDIDSGSKLNGQDYKPAAHELNIYFDYPDTTFYNKEVLMVDGSSDKKHIKSGFTNPNNNPNFIYASNNNYKATNIYFTKLIHNTIPGITEVNNEETDTNGNPTHFAELIIEHDPISGGSQKLYSCFFIKQDHTGNINNIDALIDMAGKTDEGSEKLYLGKDIPQNYNNEKASAVSYNSKNNKVIVYFESVKVNSDSARILKDLTYDMSDKFLGTDEHLKTDTEEITKNFIVHGQKSVTTAQSVSPDGSNPNNMPNLGPNSDYYLDCNPAGESSETIATYNIPINSEYTEGATANKSSETVMNFIIFSAIIASVYLVIPRLYYSLVYASYIIPNKSNWDIKKTVQEIRNFDFTLFLILVAGIIALFITGEKLATSYIIYGIFFIGLSLISIQTSKVNDGQYVNVINYHNKDAAQAAKGFFPIWKDWFGFFFLTLLYGFNFAEHPAVFVMVLAFLVTFFFVKWDPANIIYSKKDKKKDKAGLGYFTKNTNKAIVIASSGYGIISMLGYLSGY
tara:strand:- start:1438 stop:2985 length:1548 start_codon:yes stop_codon:yes gene_type:complete